MPHRSPSLWTDRPDDWDAATDTPDSPPPRRPPARRARRSRRPVVAGLAVLALAATGGGAYALGAEDEPATTAAAPAGGAISPTPRTDVGRVSARVADGVVFVRTAQGSGTGWVYDAQGTIVTNEHVVGEASTVRVRFGDDDALVEARVVGTDPSSDLAVLRVDPDQVGTLKPIEVTSSSEVAVGDTAIAVGYPLGLDRTTTAGIVSGLGREIEAPNGYRIDEVLQTDAPINSGNSGGPLLDGQGRLIGVNSQIATAQGSTGNVGIGFAVPSDTVREVVPKLMAGETIARPWIGVSTAESSAGNGAAVGAVTDGSPAARAGLRAGDVITKLGDTAVTDADAVAGAVADHEPGDRVEVAFTRDGRQQTVELTLGTRPKDAPAVQQQPVLPGATP